MKLIIKNGKKSKRCFHQSERDRKDTAKNNRIMLSEMLWIAKTGVQWRELPKQYEPWQTVYLRFRKWQETGIWEKIFHMFSSDADKENLSIDSTMAKSHQSTNGGFKKGAKNPSEEPGED